MYKFQRILQPSRSTSENELNISADSRKSNKPLLEKKRRARINRSLEQLKALLIDTIKNDHSAGYSKLEKADILELAVKYLRNIRSQQITSTGVDSSARYQAGFSECATEVSRYLSAMDDLRPETRDQLMSHLAGCIRLRQLPLATNQTSPASAAYVPPSLMTSSSVRQQSIVLRPFGHYDINSMTSSSAAHSSSTIRCDVAMTATQFRQPLLTSPDFRSTCLNRWMSPNCVSESTMDDSGSYSASGPADDSAVADHEDDDEGGVTSTWNSRSSVRRSTRPLTERNNNAENIARNENAALRKGDCHQFGGIDENEEGEMHSNLAYDRIPMDLLNDSIKDEPVWRPW